MDALARSSWRTLHARDTPWRDTPRRPFILRHARRGPRQGRLDASSMARADAASLPRGGTGLPYQETKNLCISNKLPFGLREEEMVSTAISEYHGWQSRDFVGLSD